MLVPTCTLAMLQDTLVNLLSEQGRRRVGRVDAYLGHSAGLYKVAHDSNLDMNEMGGGEGWPCCTASKPSTLAMLQVFVPFPFVHVATGVFEGACPTEGSSSTARARQSCGFLVRP